MLSLARLEPGPQPNRNAWYSVHEGEPQEHRGGLPHEADPGGAAVDQHGQKHFPYVLYAEQGHLDSKGKMKK
jgi:hypothetical protein